MDDAKWGKLLEEHEVAYLRGDLAISSPQSYSLAEMKEISEGMDKSTQKVEAAMKADFQNMPPEAQRMMLDMLGSSGTETREWWEQILL